MVETGKTRTSAAEPGLQLAAPSTQQTGSNVGYKKGERSLPGLAALPAGVSQRFSKVGRFMNTSSSLRQMDKA